MVIYLEVCSADPDVLFKEYAQKRYLRLVKICTYVPDIVSHPQIVQYHEYGTWFYNVPTTFAC